MNKDEETIGGMAGGGGSKSLKIASWAVGIIVYEGAFLYALSHALTLFGGLGDDGLQFWSMLGVMMIWASAAFALPVALHFAFTGAQRKVGYVFYALDVLLLFSIAVIEYRLVRVIELNGLLGFVYEFAGGIPLIVGAMWGILWSLDPSHEARHMIEDLSQSAQVFKAKAMREKAKQGYVNESARVAAERDMRTVVGRAIGGEVSEGAAGGGYRPDATAARDDPRLGQLEADNARLKRELAQARNGHAKPIPEQAERGASERGGDRPKAGRPE